MKENNRYDDIINLPHYQSQNRPHMSNYDRAAQFSPFAALKGYDDEIDEAARLTEEKQEMDESLVEEINNKLLLVQENISARPAVRATYFVEDSKKEGGAYVTFEDNVKSIDVYHHKLIFVSGKAVQFENIVALVLI